MTGPPYVFESGEPVHHFQIMGVAWQTDNRTISANSTVRINLQSTTINDETATIDTSNNELLVPRNGWYLIMGSCRVDNMPDDGNINSRSMGAGTNADGDERRTSSTTPLHFKTSGSLQLTADDPTYIEFENLTSGDVTLLGGRGATRLEVYQVGT